MAFPLQTGKQLSDQRSDIVVPVFANILHDRLKIPVQFVTDKPLGILRQETQRLDHCLSGVELTKVIKRRSKTSITLRQKRQHRRKILRPAEASKRIDD